MLLETGPVGQTSVVRFASCLARGKLSEAGTIISAKPALADRSAGRPTSLPAQTAPVTIKVAIMEELVWPGCDEHLRRARSDGSIVEQS